MFFVQKHKTKQNKNVSHCCATNCVIVLQTIGFAYTLWIICYLGAPKTWFKRRALSFYYILRLQGKLLTHETQKTQTQTCVRYVFIVSHIFLLFPFLFSTRRCFPSKRESNTLQKRHRVVRLRATKKAREKKLHTTLDTIYSIVSLIYVRKKAKTMVQINVTFHNIQCLFVFFKYNEIKSKKKLSINIVNIIISPVIVQMKKTSAQTQYNVCRFILYVQRVFGPVFTRTLVMCQCFFFLTKTLAGISSPLAVFKRSISSSRFIGEL